MRLLIIEDNRSIATALKRHLESRYTVDLAYKGGKGITLALSYDYDTIILDLQLPDSSGYDICREIRSSEVNTPILVLSGKRSISSKTLLLNSGADDYVTKPFSSTELQARINALMRRSTPLTAEILQAGDLRLNRLTQTATYHKQSLNLTRQEFLTLEYLMLNPNRPVARWELLEHAWDFPVISDSNVVDVQILKIRKKIGNPIAKQIIQTVRLIGYQLNSKITSTTHAE